jgi:hypothetical protein
VIVFQQRDIGSAVIVLFTNLVLAGSMFFVYKNNSNASPGNALLISSQRKQSLKSKAVENYPAPIRGYIRLLLSIKLIEAGLEE